MNPVCDIVCQAADGHALVTAVNELKPDIVILEVDLPHLSGLDAARVLKGAHPNLKLIFLTCNEGPDIAAETLRCGAAAFLLKKSSASELLLAVQEVMHGRTYMTPIASLQKTDRSLTPRQSTVLGLFAEGRTMDEIAKLMKITARTVAFHKYKIMKERDIKKNAELVRFAISNGWRSEIDTNGRSQNLASSEFRSAGIERLSDVGSQWLRSTADVQRFLATERPSPNVGMTAVALRGE